MAVCGGNEDCTISATVGYYSRNNPTNYWILLEWIINTTFYPVDGKGHCEQARLNDRNEKFKEGIKPILFILTLIFCMIISIFTWSFFLISKIDLRHNDSNT